MSILHKKKLKANNVSFVSYAMLFLTIQRSNITLQQNRAKHPCMFSDTRLKVD